MAAGRYPVEWDLRCFCDAIDAPAIEEDKAELSRRIECFLRKCSKLTVDSLPGAVRDYDGIYRGILKIETFFSLYYQLRLQDEKAAAEYQKTQEWVCGNFSKLSAFTVVIQKLDYGEVKVLLQKDASFAEYRAFIEETFRQKEHTLSTSEETILAKMELISSNAWHKFHEELLTRMKFHLDGKELTLSDVVEKSNHDLDRGVRERASLALHNGLAENSFALTSVFNNIALSHRIWGECKKYSFPEERAFFADNIDRSTVDTMVSAVVQAYQPICHRYFALKTKLLGIDKLQYWDRCAQVKLSDTPAKSYSYGEAVDLVLSVFSGFSETFGNVVREMVNNSWVDVFPKPGKASGAFACSATVDTHPFVLLNFYGGVRDVLTMAHEFGHGVHQRLSSRNRELVARPALNISETASIFAEKLTNECLLKNETDPRRKVELICSRLDDAMSTIFRQVAFFNFEQKVHNLRAERELTPTDLDNAWREVLTKSMGDAVALPPCINNFWGYITHFTSWAFYVYSYAFGALFVEGLFAQYKKSGRDFVAKYEEALSAGGTKTYREIAAMFGIDADSAAFWDNALGMIKLEVDELEALCGTLRS